MKIINRASVKKSFIIINETIPFLTNLVKLIFVKIQSLLIKNNQESIIVVTATDKFFYNSLLQLLENLKKIEIDNKIIVFDLGLEGWQYENLKNYNITLEKFQFSNYPNFLSKRDSFNKLGQYAWKPVIIYETMLKYESAVLWLDTGNLVKNSLATVFQIIIQNGFLSPYSKGTISEFTHIDTLNILDRKGNIRTKRNLTGGLVGFNWHNLEARSMAKEWHNISLKEHVIAPLNSGRENHRQDQSVLSIIAHKSKLMRLNICYKYLLGIKVNQNPGVKIFNLDIEYKHDLSLLKKKWESINEQNITKTISRANAIMLLSSEEFSFIPKKYLRRKNIFLLLNDVKKEIPNKNLKYLDSIFTQDENIYETFSKNYDVYYYEDLEKIFYHIVKISKI